MGTLRRKSSDDEARSKRCEKAQVDDEAAEIPKTMYDIKSVPSCHLKSAFKKKLIFAKE